MSKILRIVDEHRFVLTITVIIVSIQALFFFTSNNVSGQGGLYLIAISEIANNPFSYPLYLTNVSIDPIMFPYPPGAFYLIAGIHWVTGLDLLLISQYLPSILFIISTILFYHFLRKTHNVYIGSLGAIFLFTVPAIYLRQVPVDGMTTSLAFIGITAGLNFLEQSFVRTKMAVYAGACFGLTLLAHPSGAQFFGITYLAYWIGNDRSQYGLLRGVIVVTVGVILSSVWWAPSALQFGYDIFLNAGSTRRSALTFVNILSYLVAYNTFTLTMWSLPVIAGIYMALNQRWWIVIWACVTLLTSHILFFSIIMSYISAILFVEWIIPSLSSATKIGDMVSSDTFLSVSIALLLLSASVVGVINAVTSTGPDFTQEVSDDLIKSSDWVRENTNTSAVIAIQGGHEAEWFPYFSNRTVWTYHWGLEWSGSTERQPAIERRQQLNTCQDPDCLESVFNNTTHSPDYVILSSSTNQAEFNSSSRYRYRHSTNRYVIYNRIVANGSTERGFIP